MKIKGIHKMGRAYFSFSAVLTASTLFLAGCAGPGGIRLAEGDLIKKSQAYKSNFDPRGNLDNSIIYANALSEAYIKHSDAISTVQDLASVVTIGAASVAASAVIFDFSPNVWKTAGLVAGTTGATWQYFQPGAIRTRSLNASQKLHCIASSGLSYKQNVGTDTSLNGDAKLILLNAIQAVRIEVRSGGSNSLPSYTTLVQNIVLMGENKTLDEVRSQLDEEAKKPKSQLVVLQDRINRCLGASAG